VRWFYLIGICYSLYGQHPSHQHAGNSYVPPGKSDSLAVTSLLREDSSLLSVFSLRCNSKSPDYSPFVHGDHLYFVSGRPSQMGVVYTDAHNNTEITDVYVSTLKDPRKPGTPKPMDINTKLHEGPFCFNLRGDTMYFTGSDGKTTQLKILMTVKKNNKWTKPTALPFCGDTFAYCHPSLATDGRLFLSSNRKTGGHMDVFWTRYSNGRWLEPVNAGRSVNTEYNELFPFAGRKGRLYFSSNRPGGIGKLDLYEVSADSLSEKPVLLYPPLNSEADDFGIWTDSAGITGYVSSGRKTHAGDDIFYFERSFPDFSRSSEPPVRTRFCYSFYESTTASGGDTNILYYEWHFGDGSSARGLRSRHCYTAPGTYKVELLVVEKLSGLTDTSLASYRVEIPEQEKLRIAAPDSAGLNELVILDATASAIKDYSITAFYWSFGDGFYNRGSTVGHKFRKEGKYVVQLWVTARHRVSGAEEKFKTTRPITVRSIN
jgi:hypothetical protein